MATGKKPADNAAREGDRVAKVIARSGYCSRRAAEALIEEGRVAVNGVKLKSPAVNVTDKDKVTIDGDRITRKEATRVWLYYKPAGLVVSESDPEGRPTVFEKFEEAGLPRVVTVGRLDINTEGLLLLTNDGGLKRVLELPSTGWTRRYRVRAHGRITQDKLDELKNGITVDKVHYGPIDATLERQQGANAWVLVSLKEGKNREVKNVLAALGLEVNRLIRLSYGPFQLNQMKLGEIEPVKMRVLKDQLSAKLIEQADLDFDAPVNPVELKKPEKINKYGRGKPRGRMDRPERAKRPERDERRDEPKKFEGPKSRVFFEDGRTEYIDKPMPKEDGDERGRGDRRGGRDDRKGGFRGKSDRGDFKRGNRDEKRGDFKGRKEGGRDNARGDWKDKSDRRGRDDRRGGRDDKRGGFKGRSEGRGRDNDKRDNRGSGGKGKTFVSANRSNDFGDKRGPNSGGPNRGGANKGRPGGGQRSGGGPRTGGKPRFSGGKGKGGSR